jgi:hypothetical protein
MWGYIEQAWFHGCFWRRAKVACRDEHRVTHSESDEVKIDSVNSGGFVTASTTNGDPRREPSEVKPMGRGSGGLAPGDVRST